MSRKWLTVTVVSDGPAVAGEVGLLTADAAAGGTTVGDCKSRSRLPASGVWAATGWAVQAAQATQAAIQ